MAILLKVGASLGKVIHPANGRSFTLAEMQKLVGGYIELVRVPETSHGPYLVIDEEGWLKGKPLNRIASSVAGQPIAGDAFVCTHQEFEAEEEEQLQ